MQPPATSARARTYAPVIKHLAIDQLDVRQSVTSIDSSLCTQDRYSLPLPPGPYAVDHFQVGRDNVQLRTPVKFRVHDCANLQVTGVKSFVHEDGVEYFGADSVYLSYPLPLTIDVLVPSKRTNKLDPFPFFPNENAFEQYFGHLSLDSFIAADATVAFHDGTYDSYLRPVMSVTTVPNCLASCIAQVDLDVWSGLKGKYLLDDTYADAWTRMSTLKHALAEYGYASMGNDAYVLMTRIAGSVGVPVISDEQDARFINSVSAADRARALALIQSSGNYRLYKSFKCYAARHPAQSFKQNDIYQPQYEFAQIQLPPVSSDTKVPLVIVSEPSTLHGSSNMWEALASYGIAVAICHAAYTSAQPRRTPGKTATVQEILCRGTGFPDLISLKSRLFYAGDSNYAFRAYDSTDQPGLGYVDTMGYDWTYAMGTTGTSSLEFCEDMMRAIVETLQQTCDRKGNALNEYIDFSRLGVFGRSGGQEGLTGACLFNERLGTDVFKVGVAHDILLSFPYNHADFYGWVGGQSAFPKGLRFPTMFVEPSVDQYSSTMVAHDVLAQSNTRNTVGPRKQLQSVLRQTAYPVRAQCLFLEACMSGHASESHRGTSREFGYTPIHVMGIEHPRSARWPDVDRDPVYGLRDLTHHRAYLNYALCTAIVLYYRLHLSPHESISSGVFRMLPFEHQWSPWDLPGADDYQFAGRLWSFDAGGKFTLKLVHTDTLLHTEPCVFTEDLRAYQFSFDLEDPDTEALYLRTVISENLDLGLEITSADGQLFNYLYDLGVGAECLIDVREMHNKCGSWRVRVVHMTSDTGNDSSKQAVVDVQVYTSEFQFAVSPNVKSAASPVELRVGRHSINLGRLPEWSAKMKTGDLFQDNGVVKIVV